MSSLEQRLARYLEALVYGVSTRDPVTLAAASGTVVLLALAVSVLPARRAATVDPIVALKEE